MKMKIIALLACAALIFSGCGNKIPKEPPEVSVTAGGTSVGSTVNLSCWGNTVYLLDATASEWIEKYGEPLFYPNGTVFEIIIPEKNTAPDKVTVTDTLIRPDGTMKYDKRAAVVDITPEVNGNVISFSLDTHWATALSSGLADYEDGSAFRCFDVTCHWGDNVCVYTFCIRSDPV